MNQPTRHVKSGSLLRRFFIIALFGCLSGQTALALLPDKPITQYVHNAWQADEGLPQNYVVGITQTQDGYLWLATQEGLARFDGVRFTVFDNRNNEQIKENNIQALLADREGGLWFGSEGGGLGRFEGGKL